MDPEMFAKMHGERGIVPKATVLPESTRACLEFFLSPIIETEREEYQSELESFEQHEKQIRSKAERAFSKLYEEMCLAQELIEAKFKAEDQIQPAENPESAFSVWEGISARLHDAPKQLDVSIEIASENEEGDLPQNEPLQKYLGVPWPFMDRVYRYATELLTKEQYSDAATLYFFLRYLNSDVYEYWLGEGICLQCLGKMKEAIEAYVFSLYVKPDNPVVFFQIAKCYLELNEQESCLAALKICLEDAQSMEGSEELILSVKDLQQQILSHKSS